MLVFGSLYLMTLISSQQIYHVQTERKEELYNGRLFYKTCKAPSLFMVTFQTNQVKLWIDVDTGVSTTIISFDTLAVLWRESQIMQFKHRTGNYTHNMGLHGRMIGGERASNG